MDLSRIQRVLLYRLGSLGDTVVSLPALHLVQRSFPQAQRLLLTNFPIHAKAAPAQAILEGSGLVHGYIAYSVGTRSPAQLLRLWWQIRKFRPQVLVYLMRPRGEHSLRRDAQFFRACGIRNFIGLPVGELGEDLFHPETGLWESEAERLARCMRALGEVDVSDLNNWDLRLTAAETERASRELASLEAKPFIVVAIGGKMQSTDWGTENWRSLLEQLSIRMTSHALVMIGSGEELADSESASSLWKGKILNLCGRLTPRETAAVAARAELFLGRDSGPKFLAATGGIPCAVVYSARNRPGIWFPPGRLHRNILHEVDCANCNLEVCIEQQKKCITGIAVDEMLQAAMEAWKNGQRARDARRYDGT
jgi:ADP-heptose:LPS heptosyltransferase